MSETPRENEDLDYFASAGPLSTFSTEPPETNRLTDAELALRTHAKLLADPNDPSALAEMAEILGRQNEFRRASEMLRQAIAISDTNANWHYRLGACYEKLNLVVEALCAVRKALILDPGMSRAYLLLGDLLVRTKEIDIAIASFEKARVLGELTTVTLCALSSAHFMRADFPEAEQFARLAIESDLLCNRAYVCLAQAGSGLVADACDGSHRLVVPLPGNGPRSRRL